MKKLGTGLAIPLQVYHDRLADRLTIVAPATLVLPIPADYNHIARAVDTPEARAKMEEALSSLLRRPVSLRVERVASGATASTSDAEPASARQRGETVVDDDPLVRKVVELFEARRLHLDYEAEAPPS